MPDLKFRFPIILFVSWLMDLGIFSEKFTLKNCLEILLSLFLISPQFLR